MKVEFYFLVSVVCIFSFSCEKEEDVVTPPATYGPLELYGTYSGIFTVIYSDTTHTNSVSIVFDGQNYSCSSEPDHIPAGGVGTFEADLTEMTFSDQGYHPANFDWNLILQGEYDFELSDSTLLLQVDRPNGFYQYDLIKE